MTFYCIILLGVWGNLGGVFGEEARELSLIERAKQKAAAKYSPGRTVNRGANLRIAVLPIKTTTGIPIWWEGGFDPGRAITDMVVTNLTKSKRFFVFDRNNRNQPSPRRSQNRFRGRGHLRRNPSRPRRQGHSTQRPRLPEVKS